MRAFVMKKIGEAGFVDKPIPEDPGANGAIVKTTKAFICTSDVHTKKGAIGERENLTLGHEAVGIVHKLGNQVKGVKEGDRVAVNAITPDFVCDNCQRGFTSQCSQMLGGWKFTNIKDGVFAEYFHVNDAMANLAIIPDNIPDEKAVYSCDMMSTGFMGAEHANIPVGGTVAVFAQGPVGLMATAGARLIGAGLVIGVESVPKRKEAVEAFRGGPGCRFHCRRPGGGGHPVDRRRGGFGHRIFGLSGDVRGVHKSHPTGWHDLGDRLLRLR